MKMTLKRLFSLMLAMCLLLSSVPIGAFAEEVAAETLPVVQTEQPAQQEEQPAEQAEEPAQQEEQPAQPEELPVQQEEQPVEQEEEPVQQEEENITEEVPSDEIISEDTEIPEENPEEITEEPAISDEIQLEENVSDDAANGQVSEEVQPGSVDALFDRLMGAATYEELDAMMEAMTEEEYALMNQFSEEQNAALEARIAELSSNELVKLDAVTLRQGDSATYTQSVERNDYFFQIMKDGDFISETASGIKVTNAGNHTIKVETSENTPVGEYTIRFGTYNWWFFYEAGTITLTVEEKIEADAPVVDQKKMTFDKTITANANGNYDLKLTVSGAVGSKTNPAKVDIVLVIDKSGSMRGDRLDYAKAAANTLINALNTNENIDARYNIVTFSGSSSATQGGKYVGHTVAYGTDTSGWTGSANTASSYVNGISANGATNYEAGLLQAQTQLQGARSGSTTIVVFLTDGLPTLRVSTYYRGDGNGYGEGSEGSPASEERCLQDAINAVAKIAMNRFYVIGTGTANAANLTRLANGAVLANEKSVKYTSDSNLSQTFSDIASEISMFLCENVTITDTLKHVGGTTAQDRMVEVTNAESVKVTVYKGDTIIAGPAAEVTIGTATLTASYNAATGVLKLDFPDWYQLEPDYTYVLSAEIAPTEKAYEEYRKGGYTEAGDPNTGIYSGKFGFYSNDSATVTYTYQGNTSQDAYAHPVFQLQPGTLVINKTVEGLDAASLSNLAFDVVLTYPGKAAETQTVSFAQFTDPEDDGTYTFVMKGMSPNTSYTVTESGYAVEDYDVVTKVNGKEGTSASGTVAKGETATVNFTNTYKLAKVDISGSKTWDDNDNQDGKRPASITIRLLADRVEVASKTVTAAEGWAWTFEGQEKFNENGEPITYTVAEDPVEGYDATYDGTNVTNTHVPSMITISGSKTWDDADNQDGIRPASITINLLANGEKVASKVITANDGWAWTFENLPEYAAGQKIVYTISEVAVDGYTTSYNGYDVTNTHVPAVTSINVTKTWADANNQDGFRPNSVTIDLYADGVKTNESLTLSEGNNWTGSFKNLPVNNAGKAIAYSIAEQDVPEYQTTIAMGDNGYTVTNRHVPEVVTVSGAKTWDDNNNQDGARPASITINLLKGGEKIDSKVVTEDDGWAWSFTNLPKYENGTMIEYSISEDAVRDYSASYDGNNVINTHTPAQISVTVSKSWNDNNDQDGIRPKDITVVLMANGVETGAPLVLNEGNNWTGSFTELDKFESGKVITYTVKEIEVAGYTTVITGDQNTGYTITNTHAPETIEISGAKTWEDNFNQDGKRPGSITINLMKDGQVQVSKDVTAADGWKWTFTNLPKYKDHGKLVEYAITESAVENYTTTYNGYNVTNTHTPEQTSVTVTKSWQDRNDQDGIRSNDIIVKLLANGEETGKTLVLSEGNNWTGSFAELDKFANGVEIVYTVAEIEVDGYDSVITGDQAAGFIITNTHNPETVVVSGAKTWDDNNDQDGARPESITINLLKNGEVIDTKTVTEADGWAWSFTNLPKYENKGTLITYSITEAEVEDYVTTYSGYNVTNTHAPEKTSVTVTKAWQDNNDQDGIRPESITVKLLGNDVDTGKTLVLNEGNNWTGSFADLDKYANGVEIVYTVAEIEVEGYNSVTTGSQAKGYTITNSHTPAVVAVSGAKTWVDNNNQDGKRPASITINLLKNGTVLDTKTVTAEDGWAWSFPNLPKYENHGTLINYTITETAVEDYTTEINGFNVTNTHAPEKTSVSVVKSWQDNNDQDGIRPNDITVKLLGNGEDTGKTLVLNDTNNWTGSFTDLDKYANGAVITYTVQEIKVEGYNSVITGTQVVGYTITNSHTPAVVEVAGAKTWDDEGNQDGKRPASITINLLADGVKIDSKAVTADDGWAWSFTNLPKFKNQGVEIIYTISEVAVEEYSATIEGFNVINKHTPEETSVTVTKSWQDKDDQDGIRPEKITVNLLADGKKVDSQKITAEDNWTYTFTKLDVYSKGVKIVYTVEEESVEGYETVITGDQKEGFIITNSHTPEVVAVAGGKTWDDGNNQDGKRPDAITVNLLANGKVIETIQVTEAEGWAWNFTNLPKFEAGEEILYTVTEDAVEDYTTTYDGYNIINKYTPKKTSITVTKRWVDGQNHDGIRPNSVKVVLYANGKKVDTMRLTEKGKWSGVFKDLPVYENGEPIKYTLQEKTVSGYNATITGNARKGFIVTNTHNIIPKTGDESNLPLYTGLFAGSMSVMAVLMYLAKPKKGKYAR